MEDLKRCTRCNLPVFKPNFSRTGNLVDSYTEDPSCPAWLEAERPAYPYFGSLHILKV